MLAGGSRRIPDIPLKEHPEIDVTVDGADEVFSDLDLIKGLVAHWYREKIVAHTSKRVIIVVDDSKMVTQLGTRAPIPVEVVPFAVDSVMLKLVRWKGSVNDPREKWPAICVRQWNTILDWQARRD
jgi:ribose 5-phosphate isomerase